MPKHYQSIEQMTSQPSFPARNYQIARNCMAHLIPFKHSTMKAEWRRHPSGVWAYVVFSYKTQIAWVLPTTTEVDRSRYSTTTSKQQNYILGSLPMEGWSKRVAA